MPAYAGGNTITLALPRHGEAPSARLIIDKEARAPIVVLASQRGGPRVRTAVLPLRRHRSGLRAVVGPGALPDLRLDHPVGDDRGDRLHGRPGAGRLALRA